MGKYNENDTQTTKKKHHDDNNKSTNTTDKRHHGTTQIRFLFQARGVIDQDQKPISLLPVAGLDLHP